VYPAKAGCERNQFHSYSTARPQIIAQTIKKLPINNRVWVVIAVAQKVGRQVAARAMEVVVLIAVIV